MRRAEDLFHGGLTGFRLEMRPSVTLTFLLWHWSYGQGAKPLLGWGENNYGSLGTGDDRQRNTPQLIRYFATTEEAVLQATFLALSQGPARACERGASRYPGMSGGGW